MREWEPHRPNRLCGSHPVGMKCDGTNEQSRRVAERCGMIREGHIREIKVTVDGVLSGTFYYGLLKKQFDALRLPA